MADSTLAALGAHTPAVDADSMYIENGGVAKKVAASVIKTYTSLSPTLVTPALGTPASGVITACTGAPALAITNMTGTGTNLTFVNPALGTPASGVATNLTGAPAFAITNMTGTGTNLTFVNPALGTPASGVATNLTGAPAFAITNMTGTATNLTFVTPALGTPTSGVLTNCTGAPLLSQRAAQAVTATTGGGTTGLITATTEFAAVTTDSVDKQVSLPAAIGGKQIRIFVAATGCELISAIAGDKVNNVVVGATNEAALVAGTVYTCVYNGVDNWIMTGQTATGGVETAVIPDAR